MKLMYSGLFLFSLLAGCAASAPKDPIPAYDSFTMTSGKLDEKRTINIWTPPGYTDGTDSLPVLYMPDGGIKEDFPHIANTLSALIKAKSIPPVVLVGIENTQRRRDMTGPTEVEKDKKVAPVVGGSAQFRAFVKEELFPEISHRYRITDKRTIIGESLAGLFIVEILMQDPGMFDNYIAIDPSLWWNNHYLVRTAPEHLAQLPATDKRLWFAGSRATDISPYTKELVTALKNAAAPHLKWQYSDEPNEEHVTIYRAVKEKALIWTLGGK